MQIKIKKMIPFIQYRWFFISGSLIIILASFVCLYTKGLNYGIDFVGGIKLTVRFNQPTSDGVIKDALSAGGYTDATVQKLGEEKNLLFTIKVKQGPESLDEATAKISNALNNHFGAGTYSVEAEETVGPKVGKELRMKGQLAVLFMLIAMLVYVSIRFEFIYAPGVVVALIHDVIVTLGVISFFNVEFNLTTLAAILTIVGYSANDTIIIFDRIRENSGRISPSTLVTVVNESVNITLSRTIITSLTVLFVILILFFFGGGVIHDFALTFLVGVIAGSYSTIFMASPVYIFMYRHWPKLAVKMGLRKEA